MNDSSHQNTDSLLANEPSDHASDSNAALSSRGSTKATGDVLSVVGSERGHNARGGYFNNIRGEQEDEREEDGSPMLTNRFLRDLFRKEWKKYYRTPELNEKLYLHFKGFSYIRNMEQFTELKCLYFESNGCRSMLGLEENRALRSLYIQENIIEKLEGLNNHPDLAMLNLNDNIIKKVEGLSNLPKLTTLYVKNNRFGK